MIDNLDYFHPIGSIFETVDDNFDPNISWGVWNLDDSNAVIVSQNTANMYFSGAVSSITGSDTVTLAINQIPNHTHTGTIRAILSTSTAVYDCTRGSVFQKINNSNRGVYEYYGGGTWYTNFVGDGNAHENRMKFTTVHRWVRVA